MNVKLEGDYLSINILDILDNLTGEQEQQLIEQLSCSETVITHVMEQVLESFTDNLYSGSENCSTLSKIDNPTALEQARWDVINKGDEAVQRLVEDLKRDVIRANKAEVEYKDKYWDLYHKVNK